MISNYATETKECKHGYQTNSEGVRWPSFVDGVFNNDYILIVENSQGT